MKIPIDLASTIIALATPAGVGAIAVIRLSGTDAIGLTQRVFSNKKMADAPGNTIHFGYLRNENGKLIDQVLVSLFRAPHSYTRENVVEISCHGSPFIQQQIIELFVRLGARMARAGEFTLRAFLNGGLDLSQAEAVADLIAADSDAAHQLALNNIRGGFSNEIKRLRSDLIHFASLIELELDFGEEDVEFANRAKLQNLVTDILLVLHNLLQSFELGNALKNGISTVIAGRPNAGKSTLLNALLNEERAIVSEIEGTTRDTIEETLVINGVNFRLIDTAGIREAGDQIEQIGIQKTYEKIAQSTILIYVYDINLSQEEVEKDLNQLRHPNLTIIVLANKVDKMRRFTEDLANVPSDHLLISAKESRHIDRLRQVLYDRAVAQRRTGHENILANARHYEALHNAADSLQKVLDGLQHGITGDFIAMDIRHALRYLGEITGEVDVEDLLDNIFSKFCIGK